MFVYCIAYNNKPLCELKYFSVLTTTASRALFDASKMHYSGCSVVEG